jgi:thiamine-phosphate pyrophosphorylase
MSKRKLTKGLYLILTDPQDGYEALTRWAVKTQIPAVQLRYKGNDENRLRTLAHKMRYLTAKSETLFIINDRPDIAVMADADGVHVGQEDLSPKEVRRIVGPQMIVGLSTHNLDQVVKANFEPVDYIGFGPLFSTTSKSNPDPVVGPQMLPKAYQNSKVPIVAIGGITMDRIHSIDLSVCNNLAVISVVSQARDPLKMMQTLNRIIQECKTDAP